MQISCPASGRSFLRPRLDGVRNGGPGEGIFRFLRHLHERVEPGHLRFAAGRGDGKTFRAGTCGGNAQPVFPGGFAG